ncbi:MAG: SDR family oxidoreductase [Phaeospirillum sp.]|nr:SDR family oxidoreductase [Phaeospirillum sp.]
MRDIKEFAVGEKARLSHLITLEDTRRFVELTGDDNPLHVDREWAERSAMKGIVTHGMLSASFLSTIIGKNLPGPGALWVSQNIEFLAPVRLNDKLEIEAEIVEIHVRQRLLKLRCQITNQRGRQVLTGECLVKLLAKPATAEAAPAAPPRGIIVTGASRGIGAAIARKLAADGAAVIVNYRRDAEAAASVCRQIADAGGQAWAIRADITDRAQVAAMVEEAQARAGGLYGLVNNASEPIAERDFAALEWDEVMAEFQSQVGSAFGCIKAILPHLQARKQGAIVNIGSIVADQAPPPTWIPYNIAKAGMHALTRNLAEVLGPGGIRINTVSPGMTDTALIADVPEKVRLLTQMHTPLRRLGSPEDVAGVVAFLMSEAARHVTGETLRVNGGKTLL